MPSQKATSRSLQSRFSRRHGLLLLLLTGLLLYLFCLPNPLFDVPYSTVLEDRSGRLLGARIAQDGQWRFPQIDSVPGKFQEAILEFEDQRFFRHPGVDLLSIGRALRQNIREREVVSGASTITMQVIRMARGNRDRNLWQKIVEAIWATRLEIRSSKADILALYASHAPFGGNVVGLEAASWRYFGKNPELLSWAEASMLAVLPNNPSMIHPGRNRTLLREKRDRLLDRLQAKGILDSLGCQLAKSEPLPRAPLPLPRLAPHLLERARLTSPQANSRFRSTLDFELQRQAMAVALHQARKLRENDINNLAILVAETGSGAVRAYVGNVPDLSAEHHPHVDLITAPRSTGSILKPFLYAQALDQGIITPQTLLPDIPTVIGGYSPENFYDHYDGAIAAQRALIRSLNVPMVLLLRNFGLEKFHFQLRQWGLTTLTQPADHYGLTLILGGGEAQLWELTGIYASMGRQLAHFHDQNGQYNPKDWRPLHFLPRQPASSKLQPRSARVSAGATWLTFDAMRQLERPNALGDWEQFQSNQSIAWKTGTSFGYRDAWAIGITPRFTVGVWGGNADGEGRPGLTGIQAAAPTLFEVFDGLPGGGFFRPPLDEMESLTICRQSGLRPLSICPRDTIWLLEPHRETPPCSYHRMVHLDPSHSYRVYQNCFPSDSIQQAPWFVLPPAQAYFYRDQTPDYLPLPPVHPLCRESENDLPIQLIYPREEARLYLPRDLDGNRSSAIFEAAHRYEQATLYWYLDDQFLGATREFHKLQVQPSPGPHRLTLVDDGGNRLGISFTVLEVSQ